MNPLLFYLGSVILALWGLGHLLATRGVAAGFNDLTRENWRLFTMAWLLEGVTFIFLAALVALVASVMMFPIAAVFG